jgi:hypothetical protein
MSDMKEMPVSGGGADKGKPDGVSGSPDTGEKGRANGRSAGGESGGGAYPNPHSGKSSDESGFLGHGGQTEIAYYGGENPNATATNRAPKALAHRNANPTRSKQEDGQSRSLKTAVSLQPKQPARSRPTRPTSASRKVRVRADKSISPGG